MKCALCGNEFTEEEAAGSCRGCIMASGCHMLKCPNCGYEIPKEPGLIKLIRDWTERRKNGTRRKS